ncbi:sodium:calcium antiporter [Halorientalis litorea]|uniref:sodium:calcium antiporter n=1 Tax=Halorientalis litorea TaxID=2931977 RepID=UPI0027E388D4|nr:hypothetical protein [Halorientalis litorea]
MGLAVVAVLVIWKGSEYFERAARRLSKYYGLPVAVHGAIVVAVGSSFPEFSSVVISTVFHGEFSLGVGAIVGSAIFNLLVIPAFSALASEELEATRDIVHKDAQFYVISVLVLFIVFIRTHLEHTDREAYGFLLLLYALFLLWMVLESVGLVETVRGI